MMRVAAIPEARAGPGHCAGRSRPPRSVPRAPGVVAVVDTATADEWL
ncbi:hypothetical protein [Kitasatospora sp. NPDC050463]